MAKQRQLEEYKATYAQQVLDDDDGDGGDSDHDDHDDCDDGDYE